MTCSQYKTRRKIVPVMISNRGIYLADKKVVAPAFTGNLSVVCHSLSSQRSAHFIKSLQNSDRTYQDFMCSIIDDHEALIAAWIGTESVTGVCPYHRP